MTHCQYFYIPTNTKSRSLKKLKCTQSKNNRKLHEMNNYYALVITHTLNIPNLFLSTLNKDTI